MYQQMNDQFSAASRQFADTAGQINRLAIENAEKVFGLQIAALQTSVNATMSFWGQVAEARDLDGLKAAWPNGVQVARENVERAITTGQEVYGRTLKTNEAIGQIAKGQFEAATEQAKTNAETVVKNVSKAAK
ncbi:MAG: phasin family protein [Pseudomonadota bacterium]|nr:phasin family protein [Pseudomonadota bacterium]